jgi:hypothetical protein
MCQIRAKRQCQIVLCASIGWGSREGEGRIERIRATRGNLLDLYYQIGREMAIAPQLRPVLVRDFSSDAMEGWFYHVGAPYWTSLMGFRMKIPQFRASRGNV